MDRSQLAAKALPELREIASALDLKGYQRLRKAELVELIVGTASGASDADDDGEDEGPRDEPTRRTAAPVAQPEPEASDDDDDDNDRDDDRDDDNREQADDRGRATPQRERTRSRERDSDRSSDDDADDADSDGDDGRDQNRDGGARNRNKRNRNKRNRTDGDTAGSGNASSTASTGASTAGGNGGGGNGGGGNAPVDDELQQAEVREGVLDLLPEGYGFLRTSGYLSGSRDVYVSQSFVRRFGLRRGDLIAGPIRRNKSNDKFPALARIDTIEGQTVEENRRAKRTDFNDLTPLFPDERLRLEVDADQTSMRVVDLITPIGKGQRGLIVSPPKAGKTTILKQLAKAIETNNPEVILMVLLVDERPEEVTDFERSTNGTVIASTFDRPAEDHTQVAELCIERAKRLVERGEDVVILLDSITRLARAYNLAAPTSGRILSGGVDSAALYPPKRFFGAARNIEGGGSLTIIATALVETGSKMDEVIFEEFKGTGNMELRLDRKMEQKRIFPAVDIDASGTRKEELLMDEDELSAVWKLRRVLHSLEGGASLELFIDKLKTTKTNEQFLAAIGKSNLA